MLDIDLIRSQCPGCENLVHFNNAGSALSPDKVTRAVIDHLQLEQQLGGYEAARQAQSSVERFYPAMARLLHCDAGEIAYTENATRAWELALYSIPLSAGDEIITFPNEYASNYMGLLHIARQKQLKLTMAPLDANGLVDIEQLDGLINKRTRLIALTHIASQRGDIQPAVAVGELARQHQVLFLLDACQSAGQLQLDVRTMYCDFLCGSGRKYLRGPRGTGFLYVNAEKLDQFEPVFVDLHAAQWQSAQTFQWCGDARRFENFERSMAAMIGLATAVDYACDLGIKDIESRVKELVAYLNRALESLGNIRVLEQSPQRSGIVTLSKSGEQASALQQRLAGAGINTSVARASNARLDLDREDRQDVLRASLHYYNNEAEIDRFVEQLVSQ